MQSTKVTRRQLAALATALPALSQTQGAPNTPQDELSAARERMRRDTDAVAKVEVAQTLEPAFAFKV
jgi:hypothetical protein